MRAALCGCSCQVEFGLNCFKLSKKKVSIDGYVIFLKTIYRKLMDLFTAW